MVYFDVSFASLLGLFDILLAIAYPVLSISILVAARRELGTIGIFLYVIQFFITPSLLLLIGSIFIFQGWRLDPILLFGCFLLHLLLIYLGIKDIIFLRLITRRNQQ